VPRLHPLGRTIAVLATACAAPALLAAQQPADAPAPTATTAVGATPAAADTRFTVEKYLDYERASDPQISPDGQRVVYTRHFVNKLTDRWESALWIVNADGTKHHFLTKGSGPAWSPTGRASRTSRRATPRPRR
jgi:hypothetical protein